MEPARRARPRGWNAWGALAQRANANETSLANADRYCEGETSRKIVRPAEAGAQLLSKFYNARRLFLTGVYLITLPFFM